METSILKTVKKKLGLMESYTEFDVAVISDINGALSVVTQLGVGPASGFFIEDDTATWNDLLGGDPRLNQVINFIAGTVRLSFDPPANSFGINAIQKQLDEMAWRIEVAANPAPPVVIPIVEGEDLYGEPIILDGGGA